MHARLAYTLALSVSLHAAILLAGSTVEREAPPAPAPLEIRLRLPPALDWAEWEAVGERRRDEVRRLELVRHAFRRALEVWLALDLVLGFEARGFTARIGTFCERTLTPRNLLVLASRRGAGTLQP